jgi:hydrogenase maturation protein HypF
MSTVVQGLIIRKKILVRGIVQGVGFRPFVYQLARQHGLAGYVLNSSSGVTIEIEGHDTSVDAFVSALNDHPPPLACVEAIQMTDIAVAGEEQFVIRESTSEENEFVLVSPDIATCPDCWREVLDPADRRYAYPFTNCTNCGPRYTIIQDIPYDRPLTTMSGFEMCPSCADEYHDLANRRFHAQPNACGACGPAITFETNRDFERSLEDHPESPLALLQQVREALRKGRIVAIRGIGGFHLACDAENQVAVRALRERKKRSDKPFALMARDLAAVEQFCDVNEEDRELLLSPEHPIVLLKRKSGNRIADGAAPDNSTLGVMLPYTPLQWFLFGHDPGQPPVFIALVMTSGNISDEPIVTLNPEAREKLGAVADCFLFHNREIHTRVDDSVARTFEGKSRVLRRSRGYAPHPIDLGNPLVELLACGAEQKNTLCLTKGRYAILSQHIGDVDNLETLEFYQETLERMKHLFRVSPRAVAFDLHPLYLTSRFARDLPLEKIGVQHHHAHIASCMVENGFSGKVIGIACDGTGYGTDGHIWGGEFLLADFSGFERRAHFRYVPLPGGDSAVRQPWRAALSYLRETFGDSLPDDLPLWKAVPQKELTLVTAMLRRNLNTALTSSCGRLFDAVSSLIGLRHEVTFEGQAAIELESLCQPGIDEQYQFEITGDSSLEIDFRPTIEAIARNIKEGRNPSWIASCFHNTVAAAIAEMCCRIRKRNHINVVCLSGGTFQNWYLLARATKLLRQNGFEVLLHSHVPPNDGGISLGQAVIANEILQHGSSFLAANPPRRTGQTRMNANK